MSDGYRFVNDLTGEQWAWEGIKTRVERVEGCWQVFNCRTVSVCPESDGGKTVAMLTQNDSAK